MLRVSVIVPVFNGARTIEDCLDAILGSSRLADECIVVDDASTDGTSALVTARPGVTLIRSSARKGPAVARNKGAAHATGDILVFVDADVLLHPDTLARAISVLANDPGLAAVFGSYDDQPAHPSFLSQYRNLFHHWVHQTGNTESATFWSGCGAVRSDVFLASGGFDPLFRKPSMEDVEFGIRLCRAGQRVRLEKSMLCTHLKRWPLGELVMTDIFRRGVPWVRLLLREGRAPRDLNLSLRSRLATVLAASLCLWLLALLLAGDWAALLPPAAFLLAASLCAVVYHIPVRVGARAVLAVALVCVACGVAFFAQPELYGWVSLMLIALLVGTHLPFYRMLVGVRGLSFAIAAVPAQLLFFVSCALSVPLGVLAHVFKAGGERGAR